MSCYIKESVTGVNYHGSTARFTDKSLNVNERERLYKIWWKDQIALYGTKVSYFVRNFALSAADTFYGENTIDGFKPSTSLIMAINLNDQSITYSKFGIQSEDDLEAFIDITTYSETLSSRYDSLEVIEPKAGDVFQLTELGNDALGGGAQRPNGREGKYFEITERVEESVSSNINQLQGHYLYRIKARRYDFTYTDNDVEEAVSEQVTNDALSGKTTDNAQSYIDDIDVEQLSYFDYGSNDDVYGDYS